MTYLYRKIFVFFLATTLGFGIFVEPFVYGVINIDGPSILPTAEIYTVPASLNLEVGSIFDLPIYLNTKNYSINTVRVEINFDPTKISIVKSSGVNSIVGIWFESSDFDNEKGTATFSGIIPNGINTNYGLITTMTFKTKKEGLAQIILSDFSKANLNDGYGSDVILTLKGLSLKINPKIIPIVIDPVEVTEPIIETLITEEEMAQEQDEKIENEMVLEATTEDNNDKIKKENILFSYLNRVSLFLDVIKDYLGSFSLVINDGNIIYIILFIYFCLILIWLLIRRIYIYFIKKREGENSEFILDK